MYLNIRHTVYYVDIYFAFINPYSANVENMASY